ncbi:MAG: aminotransferase class I/II-fold pyridoxal phosphate-dependent enzyme, partial [Psychromonas sp.]|nr:aminotransferase class I/II-fold pyridoxal phosphate-dependent enzyme [Psychromonas sp.]
MAILHGGQLSRVAKQYQIPEEKWLDLSTGIAPFSYPIPNIPDKCWQDLPTISQSLIDVAKDYYQAKFCWPLAGSQQLIEKLPQLWEREVCGNNSQLNRHVYLPKVGYKEHQQAWCKAGYQLHFYQKVLPSKIEKNSVVVVINPNNPLTDIFSIKQLTSLKVHCEQQQSLLIIDEAFADIFEPEFSFVPHLNDQVENVIVLRSFGKFFGLAGLRIGFVCSSQQWCKTIQEEIGPWSINGPALYIA